MIITINKNKHISHQTDGLFPSPMLLLWTGNPSFKKSVQQFILIIFFTTEK